MIRSENIFFPLYPVTPNHITQKGFPATFCSIFALSARICRFSTAAFELEYVCLSARICRFWRSFYGSAHGIRNEMTASKLCSAIRLQKPSWSQRLVVGDRMERPLPYKKHSSMKDDLEPLCLIVHLVAHPVGKGVCRTTTHRHHGSFHRLVLSSSKRERTPLVAVVCSFIDYFYWRTFSARADLCGTSPVAAARHQPQSLLH